MPRAERAQRFLTNPHAWLDDPAVQSMGLEARGAYATLWLAGWDQKEPGVYLSDPRVLAQLARCTPEEWTRVASEVSRAFDTESQRDRWILHGFSVTLDEQNKKRRKDRNRQRLKRKRDRDVTRDVQRESLVGSGSGSGSGSGTDTEPSPTPPRSADASLVDLPLPDFIPRESWRSFVQHRRSLGARGRLTENAARLAIVKLQRLHGEGHDPAKLIAESVLNNWRGFFPNGASKASDPVPTEDDPYAGLPPEWIPINRRTKP